ncbi:MAG: DUF2264 domain-containing protein, partial [Rhodocyclaceae bacterium]
MPHWPPAFNPMAGNPLATRDDVVKAIRDLYLPLTPYYSPGGARVRLDMAGATFDRSASDLEGFARPLWGLVPLQVGGGADFVDWDLLRRGLANGTDPHSPEYWGAPRDRDQSLVELAAVGYALALIPDVLWAPQPPQAKAHIAAFLKGAYGLYFGENNWMYFRIMIGLGLEAIGEQPDPALRRQYLDKLDALYLDEGWYSDGPVRHADHYVAFAIHFYGLIHARLGGDAEVATRARQRATAFAQQFIRWFADDGAVLPFGRSLTYRFACASFWSALAFADCAALPWGQIKGLVLRHLRWWSRQPIAHRDGVLSIGYGYPNLHMCEPYNSGCSPYWAFKAFACMALPADHPFWTTPEEALPVFAQPATQTQPGLIVFNPPGDTIALAGGQEDHRHWLRQAPEKYSKFAYSARYGFSVETDFRQFDRASFDNMLAFSEDGAHFVVREGNDAALIADNLLYVRWQAGPHITVETWSQVCDPWHVRVHRIRSTVACAVIEGGFALPRPDGGAGGEVDTEPGRAGLAMPHDFSGIRDLGSTVARTGRVLDALPNANLMSARSSVPQLLARIEPGETVLATAVLALADTAAAQRAWREP